jgi:hypothetical protein
MRYGMSDSPALFSDDSEDNTNHLKTELLTSHTDGFDSKIFDPSEKYLPGTYLVGDDIPDGLFKIAWFDENYDSKSLLEIGTINTQTRVKSRFEINLSCWFFNLDKNTCLTIACNSKDSKFRFVSSKYLHTFSRTDSLYSGIYMSGNELKVGLNKILFPSTKQKVVNHIAVYESSDLVSFNLVKSDNIDFWFEVKSDRFYKIVLDNISYRFNIIHESEVCYYNNSLYFIQGVYLVDKELPSGLIKFEILSNLNPKENYEISFSDNPYIFTRFFKINSCCQWFEFKANSFVKIVSSDYELKFRIFAEADVYFVSFENKYHDGVYRVGSDIPSGSVKIINDSDNDFYYSVSENPMNFLHKHRVYRRYTKSIWLNLSKDDYLLLESSTTESSYFFKIPSFCFFDSSKQFFSGVRKAGVDVPSGYLRIWCEDKNFSYSISNDPCNFSKYISADVNVVWIYLNDDDFVDLKSDMSPFKLLSEFECCFDPSDDCKFYPGVRKIGCDIPSGMVMISSVNSKPFKYSISDNPYAFSDILYVREGSVRLSLEKDNFIRLFADSEDCFYFKIVEP